MLFSGAIDGEYITNGDFVNSSHVVIATVNARILMINNSGDIEW